MKIARVAAWSVLASGLLLVVGCTTPERVSYRSDSYSPKTINVLDSRTGESLLTVDVPVGQQLNMKFEKSRDRAEAEGVDTLRWSLRKWGDAGLSPGSTREVPPPSARRVDVTLRGVPEMPPAK
jgi:hypothetical protein